MPTKAGRERFAEKAAAVIDGPNCALRETSPSSIIDSMIGLAAHTRHRSIHRRHDAFMANSASQCIGNSIDVFRG